MVSAFLKIHPALGAAGWESQRFRLYFFRRSAIFSGCTDDPFSTAPTAISLVNRGTFRYFTSNSSAGTSFTCPVRSITRTLSTTSKVQDSIAPAFIRMAPPSAPGIPSINSNPPIPAALAAETICFKRAPAPARILPPIASILLIPGLPRFTHTPGIPPSRTSRLLPRPTTVRGTFCSSHKRTTRPKSSSDSGSNQTWAGPPIRMVVCLFIGSYQLTPASFPAARRILRKSSDSWATRRASWVMSPAPIKRNRSPSCHIFPRMDRASAMPEANSTLTPFSLSFSARAADSAPTIGFSPAA